MFDFFTRFFFLPRFRCSEHHKEKRRKRANTWYKSSEEVGNGSDKHTCRTRYQQTPVEVYARFIAVDQVMMTHDNDDDEKEMKNSFFKILSFFFAAFGTRQFLLDTEDGIAHNRTR